MPQLVKKRRSGWAVLAVGALVASIFAVGAAPAAAQIDGELQKPDHLATWRACLGPAMEGGGFTDVAMDSVHYDNINCLAYYGISLGKTADTFDPQSHITRSQMALFLTRAANAAGVSLGDAMSAGFTDLGGLGSDRVDAINRLASKGIMEGRTATTFDPDGLVTRRDMAEHIFAFVDLAYDDQTHNRVYVDELPASVDGDKARVELDNTRDETMNGHPANDYFGDARRTVPAHVDQRISAIYELGIIIGTNGRVGAEGTFEPTKNVTRAQMASIVMRALGHTNLRPAGLTAQQSSAETQVSVRDANFKPVLNTRVEVISSNFAQDAFNRSGECIDRYVVNDSANPGFEKCEIDTADERTGIDGNAHLQPGARGSLSYIACGNNTGDGPGDAASRYAVFRTDASTYLLDAPGVVDPAADYNLWAWSGSLRDSVDDDTELFEVVPANDTAFVRTAVTAVFSGGDSYEVKMGGTLVYEVQLVDVWGVAVGPNPSPDLDDTTPADDYTVTIEKTLVWRTALRRRIRRRGLLRRGRLTATARSGSSSPTPIPPLEAPDSPTTATFRSQSAWREQRTTGSASSTRQVAW